LLDKSERGTEEAKEGETGGLLLLETKKGEGGEVEGVVGANHPLL
jgi:hypothetical protein